MFREMPAESFVIWNDGPRLSRLHRILAQEGVGSGLNGKGRNVWMSVGAALSFAETEVIVAHDCDILNYERELLARLCWPVANTSLAFGFCKGYYSRFDRRLRGRVMRLLATPLLGPIVRDDLVARWCDAISIGVSAGIDLPTAVGLADDVIASPGLRRDGVRVSLPAAIICSTLARVALMSSD